MHENLHTKKIETTRTSEFRSRQAWLPSQHLGILGMGLWTDPAILGCVVVFEL